MKKLNNFTTILPDRKPDRGIKMTVLIALLTLSSFWGFAQTVLISPTGNGGFESGGTFAANGWTLINAASGNSWCVGTATKSAGINGAYISTSAAGSNNNYTNYGGFFQPSASRTVHFYRDVTFPAGQTQITLAFKWKGDGETNTDDLKVFLAATSVTPVSGSEVASGNLIGGPYDNQTTYQTVNITIPAGNAGTTKRLIFSWRNNNNSSGSNPAGSFDEISLTSCVPPSITASSNAPVCVGENLNLTATGSGSFSWAGPNSFTASTQNPTISNVTSAAAGTYTVTVTSGGCSASTTTSVTLNSAPSFITTNSASSVCAGAAVTLNASTGATASLTSNTAIAIPDNNTSGILSPITVSGYVPSGSPVSKLVSVNFNVTHPYVGDLRVRLLSPNGNTITLINRRGGSGDNYTNTTIVNSGGANGNVASGSAPFNGTYNTENAFSGLGGTLDGIWNLRVDDNANSDIGTLLNWTITFATTSGLTYTWNSVSGTPFGPVNGSSVAPSPLVNTTYQVSASLSGCTSTAQNSITVLTAPTASISSNTPVCEDSDINLIGSGGVSYVWSGPNGFNSTNQNPVISSAVNAAGGTYTLTVTNAFGCTGSGTASVTVNDRPSLSIGTQNNVTCNAGANGSVQMNVVGGTPSFAYFDGTNFSFDGSFTGNTAGLVSIVVTDFNGCEDTEDVTFTEPGPITIASVGTDQLLCNAGTSNVSGNSAVVGVGTWSVTSGTANITNPSLATTSLTGLGTGAIVLRWTIDQVGCSSNFDEVTIVNSPSIPAQPGTIIGLTVACPPLVGESFSIAPVADALSYLWYVAPNSNGISFTSPVDGTSITADFGATTNSGYTIRVHAINGCGAGNYQSIFLRRTISTPQIAGPAQACANDVKVYSVPTAILGAVNYTWTGPVGTTFDGNAGPYTTTSLSVNTQFGSGFVSGNVCVTATSPCGIVTAQKCVAVSSIPARPVSISGLLKACPGTSQAYSVAALEGATSYNWSLPAGATISTGAGTANVVIDFSNGFTSGLICVTATNPCNTSLSRCINVTKATPTLPGNVTGPLGGLCGGTYTYSVPSELGVLSYNWTIPAGATLVSGANTNTIQVDFIGVSFPSSANQYLQMSVTKTNACSTGPARIINVKGVPNNAAAIAGLNSVCADEAGLNYSVPAVFGASNYNWFVPMGATILSGQGTNSIVVDWGTFSGVMGVTASNSCGNSGTRTLLVNVSCRMAGVSSSTPADVNVYPNPATEKTNISFNGVAGNDYKVTLMDLAGRVISTNNGTAVEGLNEINIDLSGIAKGAYMVNLINSGQSSQIRLIVE